MRMATMRMYCPSLKKNVKATITDGKQVASKGGSLRNILYGEYEGRKCLPKTVKAEVFAQHGFAAESNFDKLSHEIAEEYEEKGKTPEEAFYVKCDKATNPQENIDLGIVTIEIGIAPVKPAEFVQINIQQHLEEEKG